MQYTSVILHRIMESFSLTSVPDKACFNIYDISFPMTINFTLGLSSNGSVFLKSYLYSNEEMSDTLQIETVFQLISCLICYNDSSYNYLDCLQ